MTRLVAVGVLALLSGYLGPAHGAPILPGDSPFRLTIFVDRETYLRREPIFLEWALTNVGNRAVKTPYPIADLHVNFSCKSSDGKTLPNQGERTTKLLFPKDLRRENLD